jgi:hypothetical protein
MMMMMMMIIIIIIIIIMFFEKHKLLCSSLGSFLEVFVTSRFLGPNVFHSTYRDGNTYTRYIIHICIHNNSNYHVLKVHTAYEDSLSV